MVSTAVRLAPLLLLAAAPGLLSQTPAAASIEARGARVRIPAAWSCNHQLAAAGGPIACTNFNGAYLSGGLLPAGGAEIEITSVSRPLNLSSYSRAELKGAENLKLQELNSKGRPALRVSYTDKLAGDVSTQTVVYYVAQGNRLYKFYLTFASGDEHERDLIATLDAIVREAALK